ncbi:MAG TPA: hypothetical protein VIM99_12485 [Blastocatellia bacterium]
MAKRQTPKPQIKTGLQPDERRVAKPLSSKLRGRNSLLLAAAIAMTGWWMWGPEEETLRRRHADVISKAEALRLPVNASSEELEALERVGPLLDSVRLEMGGMDELAGKIQIILRGIELLRNDTLHLKPGLKGFRGAWDAITSTWGGAARVLPADAAVALAAVETSFKTAHNSRSSASGLWQLVYPKPPGGTRERFEKPVNYWQQQYNDCFDKLSAVENLELRKHAAGMLAHWLNNAHNVDLAPDAQKLQDIKVPLILAQYLNGPSLLNGAGERSIRLITRAGAIGENPPPRVYVARFAVYLAILRAYNERKLMEGMGPYDGSDLPLENQPLFHESVRKHLWRVLTTPNFGIELRSPSEPTMFERVTKYFTGS